MPAYIEVSERFGKPTCKRSDCERQESPEHHVNVKIGPAILDPVRQSIEAMNTALAEIEFEISTDDGGPHDKPRLLMNAARELRAAIRGLEKMLKAVEGRPL